ncbi:MAG: hypothetical protein K8E66_06525, partial [Phycisphaerales bacterium]|nr:hypothetical protein [Phycisphaerales bacterium]
MNTSPEIQQALASRDYPRLVDLLGSEPAETLGPLGRTLRFARNMLALRERDPDLAEEVERAPTTRRVRIIVAPDHCETLSLGAAAENPLCPGGSPTAVIEQTEQRLRELRDPSRSLALAGVGDGHALTRLAEERPDTLGRERTVYLIEPDPEMLRSAMMLHDWHGAHGPIASRRFLLFVGAEWHERLERTLTPDARLPPPREAVRLCADPTPVRDALRAASEAIGVEIKARRRRLAGTYAPRTPANIAERLGSPDARVMLLTTRYSTVLQHSTRFLAEGFERVGCATHVVSEDKPWEQHLIASLLGETERFTPDLIVQIDHHRHETPGVFPDQIPFVCIV